MVNKKISLFFLFVGIQLFTPLFGDAKKSYSSWDYAGRPLDRILAKIMNFKDGFFVEVGANDGVIQSNTKLFEDSYGWRGILVEPAPSLFRELCVNRPNSKCFQCALGSFEENQTYKFGDFDGSLMSSFTGRLKRENKIKVLVRSLQSIFDECGVTHVNLFSLDTEGYELNVLKGINFDKTTFDYLIVEVYTAQYAELAAFLSEKGYDIVICLSNFNKVFNPRWDGTHNDYLFKRRTLVN